MLCRVALGTQIVEQRINSGFDSHRGQKIFSLPLVVPCFPLLGITPSGLFMGLSSTIIYTSELILCFTICVPSATRHNIHMYPYVLKLAVDSVNFGLCNYLDFFPCLSFTHRKKIYILTFKEQSCLSIVLFIA